jgi:hypothetical protein
MTTNRLYNYALLNELKRVSGNNFSQIFSLFAKPIISDMVRGDQFNTEKFISEMKNRYNIEWNDNIVSAMIPHFIQNGLLLKRIIDGKAIYFCDSEPASEEFKTQVDTNIGVIIQEFKDFIAKNPTIFSHDKTDDELLKILTDYLLHTDWIDDSENPVKNPLITHDDEYACARFISSIENKNVLQILSELSGNIKIGSLLEELSQPTTIKSDFAGQSIFLDNTLLLSYLGLCGNIEETNSTNLIKRLQDAGAKICIYSHTYEEGVHALETILKSDAITGYGLTWNAIQNREITREFVEMMTRNFSEQIENKGITIIETDPKKEKSSPYFSNIFSEMGFHDNANISRDTTFAKTRDSLSILYMIHENTIKRTSDVLMQPRIFLTTNPKFVSAVKRYLIEDENTGYDMKLFSNPFISSGKFEFLLWLSEGNYDQVSRIAAMQLIHESDKIRRLHPEILKIVRDTVSKSLKPLDSQKLEAMLQEPRYKQAVADETSNNIERARVITSSQIMEALDKENKRENRALKIEHGKKIKTKDDKIEQLEQKLQLQRLGEESRVQSIMTTHAELANKKMRQVFKFVDILVVVFAMILIILPVFFDLRKSIPAWVGSSVISAFALIGYFCERVKFKVFLRNKIKKFFYKKTKRLIFKHIKIGRLTSVFESLNNEKRINWESFKILSRDNLLFTEQQR